MAASSVLYSDEAEKQILKYQAWGYLNLPVCIAKTQYSFSDNPSLLNRPKKF